MDVPASFNHGPVSFITVHCDDHTAAAGSDAGIECVIVEFSHEFFNLVNILRSGSFRYITSVEQNMNSDFLETFRLALFQHSEKMGDV